MTRRKIVTRREIYRHRAAAWESHYQNRLLAKTLISNGYDAMQIVLEINKVMEKPTLEIDGWLVDVPMEVRREKEDELLGRCKLSIFQRRLLCVWYWTETGWDGFVRAFNDLPDVYEDYYYQYEPQADRLTLVPKSQICKKPVDNFGYPVDKYMKPVDKSVENLGITPSLIHRERAKR